MEKILYISLKLNFTPNTLGCYGLMRQNILKNNQNTSPMFGPLPKTDTEIPETGVLFLLW